MELITLKEFDLLPENEKKEIIIRNGQLLEYRSGWQKNFALYAVQRFFVEIEISEYEEMINMRPFHSGKLLDKYTSELESLKFILHS